MSTEKHAADHAACKMDAQSLSYYRGRLPEVAEKIIAKCNDDQCYNHIDYEPIPSKTSVVDIIQRLREVLFPGYFTREKLDPVNLAYSMGQTVSVLFDQISEQICHSVRHDCFRYNQDCSECAQTANEVSLAFLESVPELREILATDVAAVYAGDPAAKSTDEIIFSYPGIFALMVYRVAHKLHILAVPLLPRIMTEYAHSITGIDIHPGAEIGEGFVIDHGTGVVIGETTVIGARVQLYQGVTLGAKSFPLDDDGNPIKGIARHPVVEDDVVIYSGATILGRVTIGRGSVIGGNVWLTRNVPPDSLITQAQTRQCVFEDGGGI